MRRPLNKFEPKMFDEMTNAELMERYEELFLRFQKANERFEFTQAVILKDDLKEIVAIIKERKAQKSAK